MDDTIRILVPALVGGGTVGAVLLAALATWGRGHFASRDVVLDGDGNVKLASRDDMRGAVKRLEREIESTRKDCERNSSLYVMIDDRVGDLEQKTALIEERQSQQWERISERMAETAKTIERVAKQLEETSVHTQALAVELERRHQPRSKE